MSIIFILVVCRKMAYMPNVPRPTDRKNTVNIVSHGGTKSTGISVSIAVWDIRK